MNKNKLSILLAVIALVISTLACALGGEPTLSNVRLAKDSDGNELATVFGPNETVYAVSDLSSGVKGNVIQSKWYAVDVADVEPNYLIDTADITIEEDLFSGTIYFNFEPPTDGWPTGTYKVEVLFNDVLISTLEFSVQ